jgi:hypothetical protein
MTYRTKRGISYTVRKQPKGKFSEWREYFWIYGQRRIKRWDYPLFISIGLGPVRFYRGR